MISLVLHNTKYIFEDSKSLGSSFQNRGVLINLTQVLQDYKRPYSMRLERSVMCPTLHSTMKASLLSLFLGAKAPLGLVKVGELLSE